MKKYFTAVLMLVFYFMATEMSTAAICRTTEVAHTVSFYVNGVLLSSTECAENSAIGFPEDPADIGGKTFVGWTATELAADTDERPAMVSDATMGSEDVNYYAVFATESETNEVVDVLTSSMFGVTSYSAWSNVSSNSAAVYAGYTSIKATDDRSIQMNITDKNSGIVTTASGGKVRKVVIEWDSSTVDGRGVYIYGKNSKYSKVSDLYGDNSGTNLGSIIENRTTELNIDGDYQFIGIRCIANFVCIYKISITWETNTTHTAYSSYCTTLTTPTSISASAKYATFSYPYPTSFEGTGVTVFTAQVDGERVLLNEVSNGLVPANTGVILYKEVESNVTVPVHVVGENVSALDGNQLQVSDGNVTGDGSTRYALANKTQGVGFYVVKSGLAIPEGKPYLEISAGHATREFYGFSTEPTAIGSLENNGTRPQQCYRLDGMKATAAAKAGVYVMNGKKLIRK